MVAEQIGPYKILKILGQGGVGIVYQGIHTKLEQLVAIKVLSPEYSQDTAMRERFIQEAKLQAQLSHPNVINILNFLEETDNIYLVMEYVQGETLEDRIRHRGKLNTPECLYITSKVLEALGFMHKKGIIHRDLKPGNIILTDTGMVKVTDFGIAKSLVDKNQTKSGMLLGTLWYMSPEQITGGKVDALCDIYSLGVTLYQMATGCVPFDSNSEFEIMKAHIDMTPRIPSSLNRQLSGALDHIILKAIAKEPKNRFASADEFNHALSEIEDLTIVTKTWEEEWTSITERNNLQDNKISDFKETLVDGALQKDHKNRPNLKKYSVLIVAAICIFSISIYISVSGNISKKKHADSGNIPLSKPVSEQRDSYVEKSSITLPKAERNAKNEEVLSDNKSKQGQKESAEKKLLTTAAIENIRDKALRNAPKKTEERKEVQQGFLAISSLPSNADIFINNIYKGKTPMRIELNSIEEVNVRIGNLRGFEDYEGKINIKLHKTVDINAILRETIKEIGSIYIDTMPEGAQIFINGEYISSTPANINHKKGSCNLTLIKPYYQVYTISLNVKEGINSPVSVKLTPK